MHDGAPLDVRRLVVVTEEMISAHGTQMLAAMVVDEAVNAGFEVVLFTPQFDAARSCWSDFLRERGVKVHSVGFWLLTRWYLPHRYLARKLWRFVATFKPDLIWSPDNEPFTCCALKSLPKAAPPFFVHDPNEASPAFDSYPEIWFSVCNRIQGLSVHGQRQKKSAKQYYRLTKPIKVIWPASMVPTDENFTYPDDSTLHFGQFGRLHRHKSISTSIRAIAALREEGYAVHLHIYGRGPEETRLKSLCSSLELSDSVTFHGEYDWRKVGECIQTVHVGLITSLCEGFGLVILELLSRSRPVIASDMGSSRELLEQMGGGWVFPLRDRDALVERMKTLCGDPELVRQTGERGRQIWQRHFSPSMMFDRYLAFWKECGADI